MIAPSASEITLAMSFLEELSRRNVVRMAALYAVSSWLLLQLTDVLSSLLPVPSWAGSLVFMLLVVGFPIVLIFSWVYEMTPEGLQRDKDVARSQSVTQATSKRLDYITIALLLVAIGLFVLQYLRPQQTGPVAESVADAVFTAPAAIAPDDKSIAVLPFSDMSQAKDQEYMSDGIAEELMNLLTQVPELKVIARTSSFAFKGRDVPIAEIGETLSVANVLEGSVRKSGNTIRITAQLIRTADSMRLWSENYDRPLDDIFSVQDEIAAAVVEKLKLTLLRETPHIIATDPEAYTYVLQANYLVSRSTAEDYERALDLYQRALRIDPDYPPAWVGMSSVYSNQVHAGFRPPAEGGDLARTAAQRASSLNPNLASVQRALAYIAMTFDQDLGASARHLARGLALDPRDIDLLSDATVFLAYLGRQQPSFALGQQAVERDPKDPRTQFALGMARFVAGHWDESIRLHRAAVRLSPGFLWAEHYIGAALLFQGDPVAAFAAFQKETDPELRLKGEALALRAMGRHDEFEQKLAQLRREWSADWPSEIAQIYALGGDPDQAFEWLNRAVAQNEAELWQQVSMEFYRPLHDDPRWLPLLQRIGVAPDQLAAIKFELAAPE